VIAPPGPDTRGAAEVRILFAAARRRRRRRVSAGVIGVVVLAAVGLGLAGGWQGGHATAAHRLPGPGHASRLPRFTLPAATVDWLDYAGSLHVGDVATRAQHVVAAIPALAGGGRLVPAGRYLYADGPGVIMRLDPATGKVWRVARGEVFFVSADGQRLYISRTDTSMVELLTGDSSAAPRRLTVPAGWYVNPADEAVAGGVLVDSHAGDASRRPWNLAVWNPATGTVKIIGRGAALVLGSYTPPAARYSLVAWEPPNCLLGNCPIEITDTASLATVTVRSPLRHGFIISGASFSPGGAELAVFARTASLSPVRTSISVLTLITTRTGAVRMVPDAHLDTTEDAGWALWLPGGNRLLAGALNYSYAVDTTTYAARPFFFFPGYADHDIMDTPDINFSAVLLPSGRAPSPGGPS
jgi:hypothetical protein